jgi:hypothetical protein
MIYVDALVAWPMVATGRGARRIFGEGKESCHLVTDGPLDELHAFAARIGMKHAWLHDAKDLPHYDLTPKRRAAALAAGAQEIDRRGVVGLMRANRARAAARLAEQQRAPGARGSE